MKLFTETKATLSSCCFVSSAQHPSTQYYGRYVAGVWYKWPYSSLDPVLGYYALGYSTKFTKHSRSSKEACCTLLGPSSRTQMFWLLSAGIRGSLLAELPYRRNIHINSTVGFLFYFSSNPCPITPKWNIPCGPVYFSNYPLQ